MTTADLLAPRRAPKRETMPAVPWGHNFAHPRALYVYQYLRADASAIRLEAEAEAERTPRSNSEDAGTTNLRRAMCVGAWTLRAFMDDVLHQHIQPAGQLLYCWHGTRFIEPFHQATGVITQ